MARQKQAERPLKREKDVHQIDNDTWEATWAVPKFGIHIFRAESKEAAIEGRQMFLHLLKQAQEYTAWAEAHPGRQVLAPFAAITRRQVDPPHGFERSGEFNFVSNETMLRLIKEIDA